MDDSVAPVVAGYRLGALLGRGSSAAVWGGRRLADGSPVAIKVLPLPPDGDDAAVRELGLIRGLGGDHVVSLLDAVPVTDPGDALALVMERYDGGSLGRVVAARGRLTAGEIVTALSPVAAALGGLHRAGVVHGDLTPGNVLFDDTGRPAICDLGVSRIIGERTDIVFGTAGFVAPEVSVGEAPTPASDVYAVGALGWFCATGEAPEPGWLRQPSAEALADLPTALVAVIDACLATEPGERPSAVDLSVDLFQSAPAQPLHLPGRADDVEALTRRIRANALATSDDTAGREAAARHGGRGWLSGWAWPRRLAQPAPRSSVGPAGSPNQVVEPEHVAAGEVDGPRVEAGRHRAAASDGRGRRPVLSGVATAVLAGVFLTLGGLVAVASGWEPSDVMPHRTGAAHAASAPVSASAPSKDGTATTKDRPTTTATGVAASPARTSSAPAKGIDLRSPSAVVEDPLATAQALADARASVWGSGDPARLGTVDAPGSPAWADDAQRIGEAAAGGWRYEGVRFTVRSATTVGHSPATARVKLVLDSAAYAVVGPDGRETRAELTGQRLVLDLVLTTAGWRVSRVTT